MQIGQIPWLAKLLSMNPYRPKTVDAFDHVIHFSLSRLMKRITTLESDPSPSTGNPEKGAFGLRRDYISGFLEAKHLYPDVVKDENIVIYILTNVSLLLSFDQYERSRQLILHIFPLVPTQQPPSRKLLYTTYSATHLFLTNFKLN